MVVDGFCGVGGSAVHLARRCSHVVAVDSCRPRLDLAAHNAAVYGVADRLELLCADFLRLPATLQVGCLVPNSFPSQKLYAAAGIRHALNILDLVPTMEKHRIMCQSDQLGSQL